MSRSIEWVAALMIAHRSIVRHLPGQCPVLARNLPPPCATRSAHRITTYHGRLAGKRQCRLSTGGIRRKAAVHPPPLHEGGDGSSKNPTLTHPRPHPHL